MKLEGHWEIHDQEQGRLPPYVLVLLVIAAADVTVLEPPELPLPLPLPPPLPVFWTTAWTMLPAVLNTMSTNELKGEYE